jgi:hypothetical protein
MSDPSPFQVRRAFEALTFARERLLAEDVGPEDQKLWADMLEGEADGDPLAVIDRIIEGALDAEAMAEAVQQRRQDLAERKARHERRADRLRQTAQDMLTALDITTLSRAAYGASIGPGRAHVVITDEDRLPPDLVRIKREPNKDAIAKFLKAGEQVAGAELSNPQQVMTVRKR